MKRICTFWVRNLNLQEVVTKRGKRREKTLKCNKNKALINRIGCTSISIPGPFEGGLKEEKRDNYAFGL